MKKLLKISYLALAFLFFSNLDASAQIKPTKKKTDEPTEQSTDQEDAKPSSTPKKKTSKKTDEYFDESGGFKHRLWYGGNFNLGLNSGQGSSIFAIGITPMVGYKIIGGLSAGPRVGITYTNLKTYDTQNKISSVGLTDYSVGAFMRYKAFQSFFAHAEFEYLSQQFPGGDNYGRIVLGADGKPLKIRENRQNRYLGLGYSSGNGLFGYEIMGLYNFNVSNSTIESPFTLRFGFTYKF
jgi:hypothetical protein